MFHSLVYLAGRMWLSPDDLLDPRRSLLSISTAVIASRYNEIGIENIEGSCSLSSRLSRISH